MSKNNIVESVIEAPAEVLQFGVDSGQKIVASIPLTGQSRTSQKSQELLVHAGARPDNRRF